MKLLYAMHPCSLTQRSSDHQTPECEVLNLFPDKFLWNLSLCETGSYLVPTSLFSQGMSDPPTFNSSMLSAGIPGISHHSLLVYMVLEIDLKAFTMQESALPTESYPKAWNSSLDYANKITVFPELNSIREVRNLNFEPFLGKFSFSDAESFREIPFWGACYVLLLLLGWSQTEG